jgi:hypothetical protein
MPSVSFKIVFLQRSKKMNPEFLEVIRGDPFEYFFSHELGGVWPSVALTPNGKAAVKRSLPDSIL